MAVLTGSQSAESSDTKPKTSSGERRYSSGSAQLASVYSTDHPRVADHGMVTQLPGTDTVSSQDKSSNQEPNCATDRARHARTKAYVNGDCSDQGRKLHKCPSAPCISLYPESRPSATVTFQTEQQSSHDKW